MAGKAKKSISKCFGEKSENYFQKVFTGIYGWEKVHRKHLFVVHPSAKDTELTIFILQQCRAGPFRGGE